jgi:chromate transporter
MINLLLIKLAFIRCVDREDLLAIERQTIYELYINRSKLVEQISAIPKYSDAVRVYAKIGMLSFGGPAGQIALMHREIVEERAWIDENQFLTALNFCHLLPGPEAQQLATWIGWKLHGIRGGVAAGMLFILPGAFVMLVLSLLYAFAANLDWFNALFLGIKAAVFAIVIQALLRIAGRSLNTNFKKILAICAFCALFLFALPFPFVVLGAGIIGAAVTTYRPQWLALKQVTDYKQDNSLTPWKQSIRAILIWGLIWAIPFILIFTLLGPEHVIWKIGIFFSQLAVVTFGGAYAVLAYMAQEAVNGFGWLQPREMADGLGLAETTPGPLIMVTQFVGFLAAFRAPEPFTPVIAGIIGAIVTTWVTFAPCFLWIFALAPWIERLQKAKWLTGGLSSITAAVVGVIANLSLWFAIHVLFSAVVQKSAGPVHFDMPVLTSLDWQAALLTIAALVMIFAFKWNVLRTLGVSALAGLIFSFMG